MTFKKLLPLFFLILASVGLSGCSLFNKKDKAAESQSTKRQIINALSYDKRPFVAIFPHETNKLITMMVDKPGDVKELSIDLEYLSGNALKGGRTTVTLPATFPYTQGFLLGSCSAGGKCSFDKEITTGTVKTKLELGEELHVLKSNYVFLSPDSSSTSDQKATFVSSNKKSKAQLILDQTHGYLGQLDSVVAHEPVVITSTTVDKVTGTLTLVAPDATKLLYYDGKSYQELKSTKSENQFTVAIDLKPWSKSVEIIRDDLKGASEEVTLYLVGPIVPVK